jgi:vitamin B12 transporter
MESAYRFVFIVLAVIVGTRVSPAWADPALAGPAGPSATSAASGASAPAAAATPAGNAAGNSSKGNAAKAKSANSENAPESKKRLPRMTIVVTATRMPQPLGQVGVTTSVVSSRRMDTQQIQDVGTALREVPGIQVTQSGSPGTETDVAIRGSTAAQTLIMIDGVPVNDSATGAFDVSRLTTNDLNRIEVVRGAGGALYGSQAIGGVVNLITEEGSGAPHFSLLSEGGNRASQQQALVFAGAEKKLAYSGALSYYSTTGFRPINDNSDNLAGSLRLDYHLDENTTLHGFARYDRANISLANFSISEGIPLNPNAHQRNEFMLFKGGVDHNFGEHLQVRTSSFYVRDELRLNEVPFVGSPTSEVDHIPDETRGGNIEGIYTWTQNIRTLVGFDFLDQWARSTSDSIFFAPPPVSESVSAFHSRRQEYAGYVEQEAHLLHDYLILTGGFRVDGNSQFGKEVSPAWSVAIPIKQYGLTLRGNYAEGFRAPSFNELYFPGFGNPNLSPEISSEYDGGFTKDFGEVMSFTTTYFSRRVHNLIVTVPCTVNPTTCPFGAIAGNAGRVDTQGVETGPMLYPLSGLRMGGTVTILDQTHSAGSPQPLRVAKYSATAIAEYTHSDLLRSADKVTAGLSYMFMGDRDDITPVGTIANHDAYHRLDLALQYSPGLRWSIIRDASFVGKVYNTLDRHYSEAFGFPAPPVNFLAGLKLDF